MLRSCPRFDSKTTDCGNCISELGDRVFKRRILGGAIEPPANWCNEAIEMGKFIDKLVQRNQDLFTVLRGITSCPVEIDGNDQLIAVPPKLMEMAISVVNGEKVEWDEPDMEV